MAGRPPKNEPGAKGRILELSELDEAMALRFYPGDDPRDERRREDFLGFLRALRPGAQNPKTNTRAVHVYFYDEALRDLYEGWKELRSNRQLKPGDSMSSAVSKMVSEYVHLARRVRELLQGQGQGQGHSNGNQEPHSESPTEEAPGAASPTDADAPSLEPEPAQ